MQTFTLRFSQRSVAELPADKRLYVVAGPGAGKTHTTAARLAHLVVKQGLSATDEVLLLSYTRAAVREVRERLDAAVRAGATSRLRWARVTTLDQFAAELHRRAGIPIAGGYDSTIVRATELIRRSERAREFGLRFCHIIVDEAQDVLGHRNLFVRALLEELESRGPCKAHRLPAGFTVFADPHQAIFRYTLDARGAPEGSTFEGLLAWLDARRNSRDRGRLSCLQITGTRRFEGDLEATAKRARRLMDAAKTGREAYTAMTRLLEGADGSLPLPIKGGELARRLRDRKGRTAVLARNQGMLLSISELLSSHGIAHVIAPRVDETEVPGWVGRIMPLLPDTIFQEDVEEAWKQLVGAPVPGAPSAEEAFDVFRKATGRGEGDRVDFGVLCSALGSVRLWPPEDSVQAREDAPVILSTVHRAKGREFDSVFVEVSSEVFRDDDAAYLDEARVAYVALTRAKSKVAAVRIASKSEMLRSGRWFEELNAGVKIELGSRDLEPDVVDPNLLWRLFSGGTQRVSARKQGETWEVVAGGGTVLGRLSDSTSADLWRISPGASQLEGIRVVGLMTVVGEPPCDSPYLDDRAPAGGSYWIAPVLRGMAVAPQSSRRACRIDEPH